MSWLLLPLVASCSILGTSVDKYAALEQGDCPAGGSICSASCVDTSTNTANCGGCGQACSVGEACVRGKCQVACPGGQASCGELCYELTNDPRHCGTCETTCKPGEVCGDGHCSTNCPAEQTNCNGSCADLKTDSKHCGDCATVCGPTDECVEGKCLIACKTQLNQGITDPWGYAWDGFERASADWNTAAQTCQAFRGRLPTSTELNRVSATKSATVGQSVHMNYLWSTVPVGLTSHARIRLSDASPTYEADTSLNHYRCVCPPPLPKVYVGNNCAGDPGKGCIVLNDENKRHHLDAADRGPLTKGAAIWECGFYHGHLASPLQVFEAVKQGIPRGSGDLLFVADEANYVMSTLATFTDGVNMAYSYTGGTGTNGLSWSPTTDMRPFRCIGENYNVGVHPAPITDEWTGPSAFRKTEASDQAGASYLAATDQCWSKGGHLPTSAELAELIAQGLPGGTGSWLWTGDQGGYNQPNNNFLMVIARWTGTQPNRLYAYPDDLQWTYKSGTSYPYRCLYYPVDAMYSGPAPSTCAGGCTQIALPGVSGAKMWFDATDRTPPVDTAQAIDACRQSGGHLASERDLVEGIRHGLPNGTSTFIHTADTARGDGSGAAGLMVGVVRWTGTALGFDDLYPASATWDGPGNPSSFRCMWTNEVR